jgi:transcriptional regulator with XRE-family HTH domain
MGCRLKEVREKKQMTTQELAKRSKVSRVTISKIENNRVTETKTSTIKKLADALGVRFDELFTP